MSRALQASKIREIGKALKAAGYEHIDAQAEALGLSRSTTWTVLQGNHKTSGLTASVIHQMLKSEKLPAPVRHKVIEYVIEKLSGRYGHSETQLHRFSSNLTLTRADRVGRGTPRAISPSLPISHHPDRGHVDRPHGLGHVEAAN